MTKYYSTNHQVPEVDLATALLQGHRGRVPHQHPLYGCTGRRPGAPDYLPTLASRLYKQAGRIETALAFLITFWKTEPDVRIKKNYEIRIEALKKMLAIENAVERYRQRHGTVPKTLNSLVESGLLREVPIDPYGGEFYLDKDGTVNTTSKLAFSAKRKKKGSRQH